jgi:hypothetical protein
MAVKPPIKMNSEGRICPYPGLRPFHEEESIFFKGREEHIHKIITQLQEKRFLMVTGASGDGKSSLIYAGLIPRARAGFFKARFNNWIIADFRPEREPVHNLAAALSKSLGYANTKVVQDELNYGFSSLAKVYTESKHFVNYDSAGYTSATADEKLTQKNSGSNLMILVDQFEELFTNSQNLVAGRPSVQAATLINLLIETTKVATRDNLPIYIVCTMRSDYIGDCAAFKGLPEHIVYSQFFVPRLKRQEIHKAILEPARLSGNHIENRLIERIINDLTDGQDQLPVLQHALNRIWRRHMEDGAKSMDLIHLAKVGGLPEDMLPPEDRKEFAGWLSVQSENKRRVLSNPSIFNILNAHARELFEAGCENYMKQAGGAVTRTAAEHVLKKIFTCLTKMNDGRAVRNRIMVQEIRQILSGIDGLTSDTVEQLMNGFRHSDNSLVKPYVTSDLRSQKLKDSDILDITHEALIRNWMELTEWTRQDYENVQVLNDFKKQLERWELNGRSKDYLLTPGSLSYFNSWHINLSPNPYLLAKYDESSISYSEKFSHSTKLLDAANGFLAQSNQVIVQKKRRFAVTALTIIGVLVCFTGWAVFERNSAVRQQELAMRKTEEANKAREEALSSRKISELSKEEALLAREKALLSEKNALKAKQMAELSAKEAMAQRSYAMQASDEAQHQAMVASQEMKRANAERENAQKQKQLAEEASEKAKLSEKKAKDLSHRAISQQLAYKSTEKFDDAQISGILAIQAFSYHTEAVKNALDPVVYNSIIHARSEIGGDTVFCFSGSTEKEQKLISELHNNSLVSLGNDGILFFWDIAGKRIKGADHTIGLRNGTLNHYFMDEENYCVFVGYDNGSAAVYQIMPDKAVKQLIHYKNFKGMLRAGNYHKKEGVVDLISKNGEFVSIPLNNPTKVSRVQLDLKVTSYCRYSDEYIYIGTAGGEVVRVSHTGEVKKMLDFSGMQVTALQLDSRNNKLFVGTSSGLLKEYFYNTDKWYEVSEFRISSSPVAKIDYDFKLKKCVASSADRKITILDYAHPSSKPAFIYTPDMYIRSLVVSAQGQIFCTTSDLRMREYNTDMGILAMDLRKKVHRDMTAAEWNKYVGSDVEYKTAHKPE